MCLVKPASGPPILYCGQTWNFALWKYQTAVNFGMQLWFSKSYKGWFVSHKGDVAECPYCISLCMAMQLNILFFQLTYCLLYAPVIDIAYSLGVYSTVRTTERSNLLARLKWPWVRLQSPCITRNVCLVSELLPRANNGSHGCRLICPALPSV